MGNAQRLSVLGNDIGKLQDLLFLSPLLVPFIISKQLTASVPSPTGVSASEKKRPRDAKLSLYRGIKKNGPKCNAISTLPLLPAWQTARWSSSCVVLVSYEIMKRPTSEGNFWLLFGSWPFRGGQLSSTNYYRSIVNVSNIELGRTWLVKVIKCS